MKNNNLKIALISLGCPKNTVDSEIILGILAKKYTIISDIKDADIIVVNTCAFIKEAVSESINTILEVLAFKEQKCRCIIITGCLVQRYKEEIFNEIPEVDALVEIGKTECWNSIIERCLQGETGIYCGLDNNINYNGLERIISTPPWYSYLKIAEGCDNYCSYCIIPKLRGIYISRPVNEILEEAQNLSNRGVKELILIAQDLTSYGRDKSGKENLSFLLNKLCLIKGIEWIRLLYCYPYDISMDLINIIAGNNKICNYIDMPVQHASDKILKLMGRRGRSDDYLKIIENLRTKIPDVILRTTIMTGFPGESEDDFEFLVRFMKKAAFDKAGVFIYSSEEGTSAALLDNHLSKSVKKRRYNTLMKIQQEISLQKNKERLGSTCSCIVEGICEDGIFYHGRSYGEAPEIDGKIHFTSPRELKMGQILNVKILDYDEYDLTGEAENESSK